VAALAFLQYTISLFLLNIQQKTRAEHGIGRTEETQPLLSKKNFII